ncbi:MAG TPA: hypothetical protein VEA69_02825, partial [Tepidisphaeraceae bacterium]|nr:hypothetical protein [Tepidisphaeraceae bacterium]
KRRLTAKLYSFMLWDTPETFTLTQSDQLYALHPEFHRPYYFFNRTKKQYWREVGSRQLGPSGARWNTDTDRQQYTLWGRTAVQTQPAAASIITIVSSAVGDNTASKAITIRGVANGAVTTEAITPNGTSAVTGTTSFSKILGVTKGAPWAGTLTVSAGATTLLTLGPGEYGRSYQQLFLLGSPSTADTIEYRFYRLPKPLVNDYDTTDIPPPHEQILVWDALLLLAAYDGRLDAARVREWKEWQQMADMALDHAYVELQGLEAEPQFIRDTDDGQSDGPTIWVA